MTMVEMCLDDDCPSRNGCYRYRAQPEADQIYAEFNRAEAIQCDQFMPYRSVEAAKFGYIKNKNKKRGKKPKSWKR
jgi:hypothetical protein